MDSQPLVNGDVSNQRRSISLRTTPTLLLIGAFLLIIGGAAGYYLGKNSGQVKTTISEGGSYPSPSTVLVTTTPTGFQATTIPSITAPVKEAPTVTPANMATWKTYESTKYLFSFKYPSKFHLDNQYETKYTDQGHIILMSEADYNAMVRMKPGEGRGGGSVIGLSAFANPQHLSTLEWAKQNTANSNFTDQYETTNVGGGEPAMTYQWSGMGTGTTFLTSKGDYVYAFSTHGYEADLQQIVTTIKFTE